jgi:mono/diheme cytochrome c family protein
MWTAPNLTFSRMKLTSRIIGDPLASTASLTMLFLCLLAAPGYTREGGLPRGKALLERMCGQCHAVGRPGRSPHLDAPPFRDFGEKLYDEDFTQRLQDGLSTIHPDMPTFHFSREDGEAAVDYLRSIQARRTNRLR